MIIDTTPGKTYAVTSPNGCTVTQHVGEVDIVTDVPAGLQTLIIAHASKFEIDDDSAIVTECGGSAELVFTAATTRAASSGSGSDGMTAEERALLMGAAQRDADNTFTGGNTFTGAVDMSAAQVTPPDGWNVEGGAELTAEAIQVTAPLKWGDGVDATGAASAPLSLTFGSAFSDTAGSYTCQNQGTGSITIGAGANTLGEGSTNSITIGCKAKSTGHDCVVIGAGAGSIYAAGGEGGSVLIGAQATGSWGGSNVIIGAKAAASNSYSVSVGHEAQANALNVVAIGRRAKGAGAASVSIGAAASAERSAVAIGMQSEAKKGFSVALGESARVSDFGATAIRSTAEDGTYTQLYFSGANTPLANTYHGGAPMLGYVTKDSAGNIVAAGTRSLIDLLTDNSTFAPASLDENGDWVMPKVFHPSDLDMPIEEPTEPEEYTPLPVYPIVEPEIPEMEEV